MCFYYAITKRNPRALLKNKVIREEQLKLFDERYFANGFNFEKLPVITDENPDDIQLIHWGLIPGWVKNNLQADELRRRTLNAKSETVFQKPSYRNAIRNKRCLVLCSGFYEWQTLKGKKYPYYISLKDDEIFVFAGIWESWTDRDTGEMIKTFSIITTRANDLVAGIHNIKKRMPVILQPEKARQWLNKELTEDQLKEMMKPIGSDLMKAHTIRKIMPGSPANDVPEIMAYYHYPGIAEHFREVEDNNKQQKGLFDL
jgi:putative SOS response-associated peptidase YedK